MGSLFQGEGNVDFLGMNIEQWDQLFKNLDLSKIKLEEVVAIVGALGQAYSMYTQFASAADQKRLQEYEAHNRAMQDKLDARLDRGLINQRQYDQAQKKLQQELEKRQLEAEIKAAKRQKAVSAVSIITDTARAIMGIWADFPKVDFGATAAIASAAVGALGAAQLGLVLAQPLPSAAGYEQGYGYGQTYPMRRAQDGKVYDVTYGGEPQSGMVNKPTHFIAGEMPELIIANRDWKRFNPAVTDSIRSELARVRGFEGGYAGPAIGESSKPAATNQNYDALMAVISRNTEVMDRIEQNGLLAVLSRDMEETKKIKEDLDRLNKYQKRAEV